MFEGQEEAQRKIVNRLKRARGQLDAVIAAVESGAECKAVVTQLSATSSAIDRAGFAIISTAMKDCLMLEDSVGGEESDAANASGSKKMSVDELEKLFMSLA